MALTAAEMITILGFVLSIGSSLFINVAPHPASDDVSGLMYRIASLPLACSGLYLPSHPLRTHYA